MYSCIITSMLPLIYNCITNFRIVSAERDKDVAAGSTVSFKLLLDLLHVFVKSSYIFFVCMIFPMSFFLLHYNTRLSDKEKEVFVNSVHLNFCRYRLYCACCSISILRTNHQSGCSFQVPVSQIASCSMIQVCEVCSNRELLLISVEQPIAYKEQAMEISLTNNTKKDNPLLAPSTVLNSAIQEIFFPVIG